MIAEAAPNLTPPPGNPRFPLFDSLRAIAALSVFLGHTVTGNRAFSLTRHHDLFVFADQVANQGVAIFFLISGFLLYRPFLVSRRGGRPLRLSEFAWRRTLRIVPAYWVALTLFIVAGYLAGVTAHNWAVFYGFGQIYSAATIAHGIGAAWTLCVEVTFYAALPLLAALAARLGGGRMSVRGDVVLLVVLSLGSLVFRGHYASFADYAIVRTLPGRFLWFAFGMGLAIASVCADPQLERSRAGRLVIRRPGAFWAAAALGTVILFELARNSSIGLDDVWAYVLYALIALFVLLPGVFGETAGGLPRRVLRLPSLAWIGLISYSFYLYHTIVIEQVDKRVGTDNTGGRYVLVFSISALLSCACAAASYYIVERPMMQLRRRRRSGLTAPRRSAAPRGGTPIPRARRSRRRSRPRS
jgi:peptidoglycan/LPS O-acetylase OafA/YrhL